LDKLLESKHDSSFFDQQSLFNELDQVMSMSTDEVQACGLKLRQTYSAQKVAQRMIEVFEEVRGKGNQKF
jgi:hypothetical protein